MRIPFLSRIVKSPFNDLEEHAEKIKECALAFQQAFECHISRKCETFEVHRREVIDLEHQADAVKRRIRGHLPKGTLLNVDKFHLFNYLREQDAVFDTVEDALDWISYRLEPGIPPDLEKDFFLLVDAVIEPIEELRRMVAEANKFFTTLSEKQRNLVKEIIRTIRRQEHEADRIEGQIKGKIFLVETDPITIFHTVQLAETIGAIADHAENAGDMMRAMLAR